MKFHRIASVAYVLRLCFRLYTVRYGSAGFAEESRGGVSFLLVSVGRIDVVECDLDVR